MSQRQLGLAESAWFLLGRLGRQSDVPDNLLLDLLQRQTNQLQRLMLITSMKKGRAIQKEAFTLFEAGLGTNSFLRDIAAPALAKHDPPSTNAIAGLVKLLDESREAKLTARQVRVVGPTADRAVRSRRSIFEEIASLGSRASNALPVLAQECQDTNNVFRFDAAVARLKIDADCAAARSVFSAGLQHPDRDTRALALTKLVEIARTCPETVDLVIPALRSTNRGNRLLIIHALPDYGTNALAALPALTEASRDTNRTVRRLAQLALTNLQAMPHATANSTPK